MYITNKPLTVTQSVVGLSSEEMETLRNAVAILDDLTVDDSNEFMNSFIEALNEDYQVSLGSDCVYDAITLMERLCENSPIQWRWYEE